MATGGKFDPDKLRELDLFGNDEPHPDGHPNSPTYGHLKLPHLN
jgi:hypothetical protein